MLPFAWAVLPKHVPGYRLSSASITCFEGAGIDDIICICRSNAALAICASHVYKFGLVCLNEKVNMDEWRPQTLEHSRIGCVQRICACTTLWDWFWSMLNGSSTFSHTDTNKNLQKPKQCLIDNSSWRHKFDCHTSQSCSLAAALRVPSFESPVHKHPCPLVEFLFLEDENLGEYKRIWQLYPQGCLTRLRHCNINRCTRIPFIIQNFWWYMVACAIHV
jgi:hypothetical protein